MQQTETAFETDSLPTTGEEQSEQEQEVVDFMATVSTRSTEFDGMCGKVVNVRFEDDSEETEEIREAVRKLTSRTSRIEEQVVDTGVADNVLEVQDKLREVTGVKPQEKRTIVVTVELPDGRTFSQRFEPPTFDSENYTNEFQSLYSEILGLDESRREGIEGRTVPVRDIETREETDGSMYEIDLSYADSLETGSSRNRTKRFISMFGSEAASAVLATAGVLYASVVLLVIALSIAGYM